MITTECKFSTNGKSFPYIPGENFKDWDFRSDLRKISLACRLNALTMIQYAGSGHVGSSFSVIDLLLSINVIISEGKVERSTSESIFFTSKGHDAPGLYAVMHALGALRDDDLFTLRRLDGLPGHPEVGIAGVPTNTGSLGMGISKAKGFIYGARVLGKDDPNVFVILGDGELQEGQIWESMATVSRDSLKSLFVLVDGNAIQSDRWTERTNPLGNLKMRVESFGWNYLECDGHNFDELIRTLLTASKSNKPKFIFAKTTKGSGVDKFQLFSKDGLFYKYHSGAVSESDYRDAIEELLQKINKVEDKVSLNYSSVPVSIPEDMSIKPRNHNLIDVWADLLLKACLDDSKLVAMDADLSYDTGTYKVAQALPRQYLQFGIAEQDMVSTSGTMALSGITPLVHSFASFLTTRGFEQIFNNSTEKTRIIYLGFLAGILPSAPGHSHQAVNDLALMRSIPNMNIYEPACGAELAIAFEKALRVESPSYIRMGSFEVATELPQYNRSSAFQIRQEGESNLIITSGPSGVNWALAAAQLDILASICVVSRLSITEPLEEDDIEFVSKYKKIYVLENHLPHLGTYVELLRIKANGLLQSTQISRIGINDTPANGQAEEVLLFHQLHPTNIVSIVNGQHEQA